MAYQNLPGIQFGAGVAIATPQAGDTVANPTPVEVGIIQDYSMDIDGDIKELFGQKQYSIDSAVGKRSIKGTLEFAQIDNFFLSQLFFSDAVAPGIVKLAYQEPHVVPAASTYTITVTNSAHFVDDQGVTAVGQVSTVAGQPFTRVGSSPAQGQYSVAAGVYTFNAADASTAVVISYRYTDTGSGTTLIATNHTMGYGPVVSLLLGLLYEGANMSFYLPQVRLGKIGFKTKLDDYMMLTCDFSAFAGAADNPINCYNLY